MALNFRPKRHRPNQRSQSDGVSAANVVTSWTQSPASEID
jgi:hypothetical protein